MAPVKVDFDWPKRREEAPPNTTFRATEGRRFGAGLCPFHSPLLRASRLFSFPPLINMLKFGGSPCLLSGRSKDRVAGVPDRGERQRSRAGQRRDPGEVSQESKPSARQTSSQLEATPQPGEGRGESPVPRGRTPGRDVKPTLSQTWAVDEPAPAICVQSVDAHMSCSSHSDAQFAAFFIDPRAK